MNRSANYAGKYPEQSKRQQSPGRRQNHTSLTGHVTFGPTGARKREGWTPKTPREA